MSGEGFAESVERAVAGRFHVDPLLAQAKPTGNRWRLFQGTERSSGRRVAIKALPIEGLDPVLPRRFEKEVGSVDSPPGLLGLGDLGHPRILSILARGHDEGVLYYVTPWLHEGSLRTRLEREGRVAVADAVIILRDLAEALGRLHDEGFVHGRVKPENVLFDQGRAVLADGHGRFAEQVFTPDEMQGDSLSPESMAAVPIDHRADICSLAIVGFEMLAGHHPFVGKPMRRILSTLFDTAPSLTTFRPDVPAELAALLARALATEAAHRFANMEQFRAAIATV